MVSEGDAGGMLLRESAIIAIASIGPAWTNKLHMICFCFMTASAWLKRYGRAHLFHYLHYQPTLRLRSCRFRLLGWGWAGHWHLEQTRILFNRFTKNNNSIESYLSEVWASWRACPLSVSWHRLGFLGVGILVAWSRAGLLPGDRSSQDRHFLVPDKTRKEEVKVLREKIYRWLRWIYLGIELSLHSLWLHHDAKEFERSGAWRKIANTNTVWGGSFKRYETLECYANVIIL